MNESVNSKLQELKSDYTAVNGQPFSHFYCPILFRDEEAELCKAHIVNQAFSDSSKAWTVQRKDVDNFYGSMFEADFVDVREFADISPSEILTDKTLSKRFNSKILLDNEPVEHFFAPQGIPQHFTPLQLENVKSSVPFGLKMNPNDVISAQDGNWEIEISRDVRLPMMVSLMKAAHLTFFDMLGYRYAHRPASYFIGRQILGEFFLQNSKKSKPDVLKEAHSFFRPYVHMVRPLIEGLDFQGTATDRNLLVCMGSSGSPWAMIVFVKTSFLVHAVLIPVFDNPDRVATFMDFLQNDNSAIQVASCRFEKNQWEISKDTKPLVWPKTGVLYPS